MIFSLHLQLVFVALFYLCHGKQYHIQTDEGDTRFFKYETENGQYRKETRMKDGSIVGSYGWVDQNGYLRLYDYIADDEGYRVVRTRKINPDKISSNSNEPLNLRILPKLPSTALPHRPIIFPGMGSPPQDDSRPLSKDGPRPQPQNGLRPVPMGAFRPVSLNSSRPQNVLDTRPVEENVINDQLDAESIYFPDEMNGGIPGRKTQTEYPQTDITGLATSTSSTPFMMTTNKRPTIADLYNIHNPFDGLQSKINSEDQQIADYDGHSATTTYEDSEEPSTQASISPSPIQPHKPIKQVGKRVFKPLFQTTSAPTSRKSDYRTIYNLKKQFHVEKTLPNGDREGSHGYVDPFGILRITHYTTGTDGHKTRFENKFVGKNFDTSSLGY